MRFAAEAKSSTIDRNVVSTKVVEDCDGLDFEGLEKDFVELVETEVSGRFNLFIVDRRR